MYCEPLPVIHEPAERPVGFIAPNLSPEGLELVPTTLADGVYGLVANQIPKDNNGLIIGERAALVVDSGITPGMGRYISNLADSLSDAPVRYLANTTYHGDHTFGNVAFGPEVAVVSSRINKSAMTDLEEEKAFRGESMYGHPGMAEVDTWRKPDVTFDRFLEIDLETGSCTCGISVRATARETQSCTCRTPRSRGSGTSCVTRASPRCSWRAILSRTAGRSVRSGARWLWRPSFLGTVRSRMQLRRSPG